MKKVVMKNIINTVCNKTLYFTITPKNNNDIYNLKIYSKMIYMEKKVNKSLYEDNHPKSSTKGTGFKNRDKPLETLEIIKDRNIIYQKQVVNTMYNRAKYHPHQTEAMREAMKVFEKWLQKNIKK